MPKGKIFKTEGINPDFYTNRIFRIRRGSFNYSSNDMPSWDDDVFYKMEQNGPVSLAPKHEEEKSSTDNNDDKDKDDNNDTTN